MEEGGLLSRLRRRGVGARRATRAKLETIDAYLAALSDDQRAALERVRKIIRALVPRVEEHVSYQMLAFRLDGRRLVWIGASAKHCAIYGGKETHARELAD